MTSQPTGYCAFDKYIGRYKFSIGRRELGTVICGSGLIDDIPDSHSGELPSLDYPKSDGCPPLQKEDNEFFLPSLEMLFDYTSQDVKISDVPIYIVQTIKDPEYKIGFIQQTILSNEFHESDRFKREFKRLDKNIQTEYHNIKKEMENGDYSRGSNFEKIRGFDKTFSVRLNKKYRFSLTTLNDVVDGKWICCRIGLHDDIYRNPYCDGLRHVISISAMFVLRTVFSTLYVFRPSMTEKIASISTPSVPRSFCKKLWISLYTFCSSVKLLFSSCLLKLFVISFIVGIPNAVDAPAPKKNNISLLRIDIF